MIMFAAPGRWRMLLVVWIWIWTCFWSPALLHTGDSDPEPPGTRTEDRSPFPVLVWKLLKVLDRDEKEKSDFSQPLYHCGKDALLIRSSLIRHAHLHLEDEARSSLPDGCRSSVYAFKFWQRLKLPYSGCNTELWVQPWKVNYYDHLLQENVTGLAACRHPSELTHEVPPVVNCGMADITVKLPPRTRLEVIKPLSEDGMVGNIQQNESSAAIFVKIPTSADTDSVFELVYLDSAGDVSVLLAACFDEVVQSEQSDAKRVLEEPELWELAEVYFDSFNPDPIQMNTMTGPLTLHTLRQVTQNQSVMDDLKLDIIGKPIADIIVAAVPTKSGTLLTSSCQSGPGKLLGPLCTDAYSKPPSNKHQSSKTLQRPRSACPMHPPGYTPGDPQMCTLHLSGKGPENLMCPLHKGKDGESHDKDGSTHRHEHGRKHHLHHGRKHHLHHGHRHGYRREGDHHRHHLHHGHRHGYRRKGYHHWHEHRNQQDKESHWGKHGAMDYHEKFSSRREKGENKEGHMDKRDHNKDVQKKEDYGHKDSQGWGELRHLHRDGQRTRVGHRGGRRQKKLRHRDGHRQYRNRHYKERYNHKSRDKYWQVRHKWGRHMAWDGNLRQRHVHQTGRPRDGTYSSTVDPRSLSPLESSDSPIGGDQNLGTSRCPQMSTLLSSLQHRPSEGPARHKVCASRLPVNWHACPTVRPTESCPQSDSTRKLKCLNGQPVFNKCSGITLESYAESLDTPPRHFLPLSPTEDGLNGDYFLGQSRPAMCTVQPPGYQFFDTGSGRLSKGPSDAVYKRDSHCKSRYEDWDSLTGDRNIFDWDNNGCNVNVPSIQPKGLPLSLTGSPTEDGRSVCASRQPQMHIYDGLPRHEALQSPSTNGHLTCLEQSNIRHQCPLPPNLAGNRPPRAWSQPTTCSLGASVLDQALIKQPSDSPTADDYTDSPRRLPKCLQPSIATGNGYMESHPPSHDKGRHGVCAQLQSNHNTPTQSPSGDPVAGSEPRRPLGECKSRDRDGHLRSRCHKSGHRN